MSASWTSRVRFEVRITRGGLAGLDRADLRDRDLEVRQDLEQVRLELLVRAVDLVDEQHRRDAVVALERLEQRPPDQEVRPEDVVGAGVLGLAAGLEQPDLEHLARIVPLVDRRVDVEALVALEPDEPGAERRREHLGELGLADAGLAFEQQRAPQLQGEEDRGRERAIGDVVAPAEILGQRLDRARAFGSVVSVGHGHWMLHARTFGQGRRPAGRQRSGRRAATRWSSAAIPSRSASTSAARKRRSAASLRAAPVERCGAGCRGALQLPDPFREANPHLALHLVEQVRQPTLDLEADLLDQVTDERPRLLASIHQATAALVEHLLAAVQRGHAEHRRADDRRTQQRPDDPEQLDTRLGTGHRARTRP